MRYVFGDYLLDIRRYELLCRGQAVKLQPKVFQVLAYLIAHRDRVVSKDELLEQAQETPQHDEPAVPPAPPEEGRPDAAAWSEGNIQLCPVCRHTNPAAALFCNACASPLTQDASHPLEVSQDPPREAVRARLAHRAWACFNGSLWCHRCKGGTRLRAGVCPLPAGRSDPPALCRPPGVHPAGALDMAAVAFGA
jgi:Transcriptional regulatory protein, C terminal